jgi:alpha-tubulin suppressor-like RCC1 family protein
MSRDLHRADFILHSVAILFFTSGLAACGSSGLDAGTDEFFTRIPPEGFPRPMRVSETLAFVAVSVGAGHSCALQADGAAWCWGSSEYGQLGSSAPMERCADGQFPCSGTPLPVNGTQALGALAASDRHTCGLDAAGQAWCWGFGLGGQLGDGRRQDSIDPVRVAGGHEFVAIAAAVTGSVTCGLTTAGAGWCWGPDVDGVLGNGTREGAAEPVQVASDRSFVSIGVGQLHACAVTTSGEAYCWGSNWFGQLGVGTAGGEGGLFRSTTPVLVNGGIDFAQISAGGEHTCALSRDGRAYCWGLGHLTGTTNAASYVSTPVAIEGNGSYVAISTGFSHTCALTDTGAIDCWGENFGGELGNGTFTPSDPPVRVASREVFAAVSAGGPTCAVTRADAAWCWGSNPWGGVGQQPSDP